MIWYRLVIIIWAGLAAVYANQADDIVVVVAACVVIALQLVLIAAKLVLIGAKLGLRGRDARR